MGPAWRYRLFEKRGGEDSLRVGLVFGPRLLEGDELGAGGIDRDDPREGVERDLEAPRIGDLRYQADVGERNVCAKGVGSGREHRLERSEAFEDPVVVPGVDRRLLLTELVLEVAQRRKIVERMDVAGDELRGSAHLRPLDRVMWQERGLRMDLVDIFDDGERLGEHFPGVERECRYPHQRFDRPVFGLAVDPSLLLQVDRNHVVAEPLEVERDAHPVGGGRTKIRIELPGAAPALISGFVPMKSRLAARPVKSRQGQRRRRAWPNVRWAA